MHSLHDQSAPALTNCPVSSKAPGRWSLGWALQLASESWKRSSRPCAEGQLLGTDNGVTMAVTKCKGGVPPGRPVAQHMDHSPQTSLSIRDRLVHEPSQKDSLLASGTPLLRPRHWPRLGGAAVCRPEAAGHPESGVRAAGLPSSCAGIQPCALGAQLGAGSEACVAIFQY